MTPQETTAHALDLGITREAWPEFWRMRCHSCDRVWGLSITECPRCKQVVFLGEACTLPDPDSADPRACLWEPFYMRALGWPLVYLANDKRWRVANDIKSLTRMTILGEGPTPTAALRAAWLAKGASK